MRSWSDLYWMWKLLLSYPVDKQRFRRYLIVKIGVRFIGFNWIRVKIITLPSWFPWNLNNLFFRFLFFWTLKHIAKSEAQTLDDPPILSHLSSFFYLQLKLCWNCLNRGGKKGKRHCPNLHPLLVREFAHRVVVNGFSLDRLHCSASDPDEFLLGWRPIIGSMRSQLQTFCPVLLSRRSKTSRF